MAITQIPSEFISTNAISGTIIADNAITAVHIATNAVSGTLIADNAITAVHIATNAVSGTLIADNAVTAVHIAGSSITATQIQDNAIGTGQLAGIARGKIIYGDLSGNPQLLTLGSNGQVLKSNGTDISWGSISQPITALNSATENELVTVGATTTELNAESGLTWDTNTLAVTGAATVSTTLGVTGTATFTGLVDAAIIDGVNFKVNGGQGSDGQVLTSTGIGVAWEAAAGGAVSGLTNNSNATWMTVDSTEQVGIGTASPAARLHIDGMVAGEMAFYIEEHRNDVISGEAALCFIDVTDSVAPFAALKVAHAGTGSALDVQGITTIKTKGGAVAGLFGHGASSTSTAAYFQVPDNGNIGMGRRPQYYGSNKYIDIGPADTNGACVVQLLGHNSAIKLNLVADTTKGHVYTESNSDLALGRNQTAYFTINSSGVMSGDFNDTSDRNLKENIQSITASTAIIKQLRPVTFDWKEITHKNNKDEDVVVSARRNKAGFIAQEVEIISGLEHAVSGTDYVDGTDIVESKSLDTLTILAHAIKTIQELEARITTLEG